MGIISKYLTTDFILTYIKDNFFGVLPAIILILLYKTIRKHVLLLLDRTYRKTFNNQGMITFLNSISTFIVDLILIFTILDFLGIRLHKFATLISAFSLVFGFAFKDVLGNIFGGIIILLFKPFVVEDLIEYAGYEGKVSGITLFYTSIMTYNNEEVIIPNGSIISSEVKNISRHTYRRLDITVGVGYGSNIEEVKSTIKDILKSREDLFELEKKPYLIGMGEIGASSLNFDIKVHVKPENLLIAKYYLNENIKTEFDKKGIELPFNIIDLQVNPNFNKLDIEKTS